MILGSLRARAPAAFRETEIRSIGYAPNRSALLLDWAKVEASVARSRASFKLLLDFFLEARQVQRLDDRSDALRS